MTKRERDTEHFIGMLSVDVIDAQTVSSISWPPPRSPERTERWLVFVEAHQATLGHVGHDFNLTAQVQDRVPS